MGRIHGLPGKVARRSRWITVRLGRIKGPPLAKHGFRFDYDYEPRLRPYERTTAGLRILELIHGNRAEIEATLETVRGLREHFAAISTDGNGPAGARWMNSYLPAFDCMMVYALIAARKPACYLEVG